MNSSNYYGDYGHRPQIRTFHPTAVGGLYNGNTNGTWYGIPPHDPRNYPKNSQISTMALVQNHQARPKANIVSTQSYNHHQHFAVTQHSQQPQQHPMVIPHRPQVLETPYSGPYNQRHADGMMLHSNGHHFPMSGQSLGSLMDSSSSMPVATSTPPLLPIRQTFGQESTQNFDGLGLNSRTTISHDVLGTPFQLQRHHNNAGLHATQSSSPMGAGYTTVRLVLISHLKIGN